MHWKLTGFGLLVCLAGCGTPAEESRAIEAVPFTQVQVDDKFFAPWDRTPRRSHAISPDTALPLGRCCGTSAEVSMDLQSAYALDVARRSLAEIEADVKLIVVA